MNTTFSSLPMNAPINSHIYNQFYFINSCNSLRCLIDESLWSNLCLEHWWYTLHIFLYIYSNESVYWVTVLRLLKQVSIWVTLFLLQSQRRSEWRRESTVESALHAHRCKDGERVSTFLTNITHTLHLNSIINITI